MRIEVAYAAPERQAVVTFDLEEGATLSAALCAARLPRGLRRTGRRIHAGRHLRCAGLP